MPVTWTFLQLLVILLVGFTFLIAAFSRSNPMSETVVLVIGAHYVVINSTCWNLFLHTWAFKGGEELFRFGVSPLLPAASVYLGIVAAFAVFFVWIAVMRAGKRYTQRQRWAFSASSLTFMVGIVVSLQTPIAVQAWIAVLAA